MAMQFESATVFTRDEKGTVGTIPPLRVEGKSDQEAIRNMQEIAQSIVDGCRAMLARCDKITGAYDGQTIPVQPFVYHRERPQ